MKIADEIAYCKHYLNECAKLNKWREGALFVDSLPETLNSVSNGWLARHIKACAEFEADFQASFAGYAATRERLSFLPGVEVKLSRPVAGGKINIGLYLHRLKETETGREYPVLEKVYPPTHLMSFENEALLMERVDSKALCAPDFFGRQTVDQFHCVYYRHINGVHLTEAEFETLKPQLVTTLWQADAARLANAESLASVRSDLLGFYTEARLAALAKAANSHLLSRKGKHVRSMLDNALSRVTTLPTFVLHSDLYKGNVLREKSTGRHFIVDWDKWSVALVGDGLSFDTLTLDQSLADLVDKQVTQQAIDRDDLLSGIMLHDLKFHIQHDNFIRSDEWLGFLKGSRLLGNNL